MAGMSRYTSSSAFVPVLVTADNCGITCTKKVIWGTKNVETIKKQ